MARPSRYSADFRARAMGLVAEARPEHDTVWRAQDANRAAPTPWSSSIGSRRFKLRKAKVLARGARYGCTCRPAA